MKIKIVSFPLLLGLMISMGTAYNTTGRSWSSGSASYEITNSVPSGWANNLEDADDAWDSTSASFVFDQVNNADNYIFYDYIDGAGDTLAEMDGVANYFGDIQQVNTTFDDSEDWAQAYDSNSYMVTNVATHEVGHWLQLGHSSVSGATMEQGTYKGDISWESLEQDDIDGIKAIY